MPALPEVAVVNLAWQMRGDRRLLAEVCAGADVVLVCESLAARGRRPLPLAAILPYGWATNQDTSTPAHAGSAVCWRTATMEPVGRSHLVRLSRAGFRVRDRYLSWQRLRHRESGDTRPWAAFHAPILRTGRQREFYRNLTCWLIGHSRAVAGGDANRRPARVRRTVDRRTVGAEVMVLLLPDTLRSAGFTADRWAGTDHPVLRVRLARRRRAD